MFFVQLKFEVASKFAKTAKLFYLWLKILKLSQDLYYRRTFKCNKILLLVIKTFEHLISYCLVVGGVQRLLCHLGLLLGTLVRIWQQIHLHIRVGSGST